MKLDVFERPDCWTPGQRIPICGQCAKEDVHAQGLWHWSVHLLVRLDNGGLVLRRRGEGEARYPGLFTTTLGTHVPSGMGYVATLRANLDNALEFQRVGEFMIEDRLEHEVCGLYVATIRSQKQLPMSLQLERSVVSQAQAARLTVERSVTPHLASCLRLAVQGG